MKVRERSQFSSIRVRYGSDRLRFGTPHQKRSLVDTHHITPLCIFFTQQLVLNKKEHFKAYVSFDTRGQSPYLRVTVSFLLISVLGFVGVDIFG